MYVKLSDVFTSKNVNDANRNNYKDQEKPDKNCETKMTEIIIIIKNH